MNILEFLLILAVLVNSCFLPFLYAKIWFLFVSISILVCLVIFSWFVKKKKKFFYNNTLFFVTFLVSIFNLLVAVLGYTTNFVLINVKNKKIQRNVLTQLYDVSVIKGRVFVLGSLKPVSNAKISILKTDVLLDVFYTDADGKFEYVVSDEILDTYISLKIEHPEFEPYETKFLLSKGMVRELEVYLCRK